MSRTFKDCDDLDHMAPNARAAHERARHDKLFAAALGFYTGVNSQGETVTEPQALAHIATVLDRGQ